MHGARLNFIARFIMSLITVRTVSLGTLASVLNAAVDISSNEKRIKRFFGAVSIDGEMLAGCVLSWLPNKPYLLILDRTNWKLGSVDINILMLGVAHEGMAYPLLWTILPRAYQLQHQRAPRTAGQAAHPRPSNTHRGVGR